MKYVKNKNKNKLHFTKNTKRVMSLPGPSVIATEYILDLVKNMYVNITSITSMLNIIFKNIETS